MPSDSQTSERDSAPAPCRVRRAGARWREGAPDYILDVFRTKYDTYVVFFCADIAVWNSYRRDWEIASLEVNELPTSPNFGVSMWSLMFASDVVDYRYRNGRRRIRWLDIPEDVRKHIIARAEE